MDSYKEQLKFLKEKEDEINVTVEELETLLQEIEERKDEVYESDYNHFFLNIQL